MNGTIGRGTAVHATNGSYANCGKGMGRNAVTATADPIDCAACLKLQPAPAPERFKVTYQVNTIGRGWMTRQTILKGQTDRVQAKIAEMMNTSGYRVLTSEKI